MGYTIIYFLTWINQNIKEQIIKCLLVFNFDNKQPYNN